MEEWNVSQRTKLTAAENKLLFSAGEWKHGFEFQSRYIALRIKAGESSPVVRGAVWRLFHLSESQEIKSRTEVQGHRIFFSAGKTGIKNVAAQEKCSAALSTEIASIGLCQPQSNPQPKGVWTSLRGQPLFTPKKEK